MPDDRKKQGPADDTRVNVNQDHEVRYWTEKFKCTPEELRQAVKAVGVMVKDVQGHLGK